MGYLLGLGDRHPSNLMLDRYSGKLLHIDFGDCFEASMHREKFPEKVLTAGFCSVSSATHSLRCHCLLTCCMDVSVNATSGMQVPFRLTRMMIKAMEVSGIEGNFRFSCEETMRVLRNNKESVIAMLEAFVHDPLINWRLLNTAEVRRTARATCGIAPAICMDVILYP